MKKEIKNMFNVFLNKLFIFNKPFSKLYKICSFNNLLNWIFKQKNNTIIKNSNIRKIYFGIRIRLLSILTLVMIVIISILSLIMYLNQRKLLQDEKYRKASTLTRILGGPAEFYLDKNIETTKNELRIKYETIVREASSFKAYNNDIEKIILTDEKGKVQFSTFYRDRKRKTVFPYIKESLKQKEEKLLYYDFEKEIKHKKSKKKEKKRFRSITYPIFLHKGNVIDLLNDFSKYYQRYHESEIKVRNKIYRKLFKKYKATLGDEFNPRIHPYEKGLPEKINKGWDIDFLFLKLFANIMIIRDKRIKKGEKWLWRDKWLYIQKQKKIETYLNDMPLKAKTIHDLIIKRMNYLSSEVDNVRRLGSLAIIFNIDKIKEELDKNINQVMIIASIMIAICSIAFLLVLNFIIQNLKKLEKWALSVSGGNLDTKIKINTKDEIGRLGDIFNSMIYEIKIKYHLEKFVSKSTRNMIETTQNNKGKINLGKTVRKNFAFIFSDIRGFTAFSEKNPPETVMQILNFYLDLQAKIIKEKKGDIDDYTGDQIMAHFSGEKKIDAAIKSAIEIMQAIKKVNIERQNNNLSIFEIGIGIHGGNVVVGNIGSGFRMDFACVGDAVNLSARLCSAAKPNEILISKELYFMAKNRYRAKEISPISVKGKSKKISILSIVTK